ncbi:hypothetical protein VP01_123g1, partial [Puccinia sorghi]
MAATNSGLPSLNHPVTCIPTVINVNLIAAPHSLVRFFKLLKKEDSEEKKIDRFQISSHKMHCVTLKQLKRDSGLTRLNIVKEAKQQQLSSKKSQELKFLCLLRKKLLTNNPSVLQTKKSECSEYEGTSNEPQNDFHLAATICDLHKTHQMANHLHQGFPIFQNPINSNEGITPGKNWWHFT